MFQFPHAFGSDMVVVFECLWCQEHVTDRATGVGKFTLLNNHYHVLPMLVNEVNPTVGAISQPPPSALDWAPYQSRHYWKRDPIYTGLWWGWGVLPLRVYWKYHSGSAVCRQWPHRQVRRAIQASDPLLLPHTVWCNHPCHPSLICSLWEVAVGLSEVEEDLL